MNYKMDYEAESKVIKGLILRAEGATFTLERGGEIISANAKGFNTLVKMFDDDFIEELVSVHHWLVKKNCSMCGKTFYRTQATAKAHLCSDECKRKHRQIYQATRGKQLKEEKKASAAEIKNSNLDKEVDRARELGLSYGQYKAQKYIQEMEKIKVD